MSTKRRDTLMRIQNDMQAKWDECKAFEEDAPENATNKDQAKFVCTFPYPYSNGKLHLGHAFTMSKAEFAAGFKRLTGVQCLFPFGFHTTGMPIQACANKLKKELELYGTPPVFPCEQAGPDPDDATDLNGTEPGSAQHATKGKLAAKKSQFKYQWEILKESGVPEEILPRFADPLAWLDYFPQVGVADLKRFGLKVDWRRAFITTDVNPYYDAFIRWQFNTLRSLNKIKFGKRHAVYSVVDRQACADHDRSAGEGVQPQEYTLILMELQRLPSTPSAAALEGRKVYMPAATLRPETMYGQTNCWVLPSGEYRAYETRNGDVFICSEHSAKNMAYQDILPEFGCVKHIGAFKGSELIGTPLTAPHAAFETIYVLPLMTVSMFKGTGVVTSVPSDAPDDYRGLMDLKEKEALRAKFGVKDEWVLPFEPVPIIETPGYGDLAAVEACRHYKIKTQNDKEGLARAKEDVYRAGFYSGTMIVGSMAGEAVQVAKPRIREEMIAAKLAMAYSEPESKVVDRNGEQCVVALCDQWYLEYGEETWRAQAEKCLESMELFAVETRKAFVSVLDWLKEWACSRSFGLGTRLPWDTEWLIESLSDSTIYMAFYTVAHLLQGGIGNLKGSRTGPLGITPEQMTDSAWDFVFFGKNTSNGDMSFLDPLRKEFLYWYPVDLRVSGKDLVGNHLTFFIYNHVAIFPEEHWPTGIRVNGHVTLNAEKMSKSTGNFITLEQAIDRYSSDGVRFALADAGDTVEDANFSTKTADDAVLKLSTLVEFVEEGVKVIDGMRTGTLDRFHDRVFSAQIENRLNEAKASYERMHFRDALKAGFFEFVRDLGRYREAVGADKNSSTFIHMHRTLFVRYVEAQTFVFAPICTHTAEYLWSLIRMHADAIDDVKRAELVVNSRWPDIGVLDAPLLAADEYLNELLSRIRASLLKPVVKKKKNAEPSMSLRRDKVAIYVCVVPPQWQVISLQILKDCFDQETFESKRKASPDDPSQWWTFPGTLAKTVKAALPPTLQKNKKVMPFVAKIRRDIESGGGAQALEQTLAFDEMAILKENLSFIQEQLQVVGVTSVSLHTNEASPPGVAEALPGVPGVEFSSTTTPQTEMSTR